jgi:GAF domain-containing protein
MKRRLRTGVKAGKAKRRKTATPKRPSQPKAVTSRRSGATTQETETTRLARERDEALEQQAATGELLKVISSSKFDLQAVLDTLLETAVRLCGADIGVVRRRDGDSYPLAATFGYKSEWRTDSERYPGTPTRGSIFGRTVIERRTVHVPDVLQDPEFARANTRSLIGFRAALGVPLLREGNLIGIMAFQRFKPGDFTLKQIELVETFATQAVIAIENARLLNELRQRTTDLSASLEQQTATSEILHVISSSRGELQPVFEAMLANAVRLCEAKFGVLYRYDGHLFHPEALIGAPQPLIEFHQRRGAFETVPGTPLHRLWQTREVVHTADDAGSPSPSPSARFGGAQSHLAVPMFKGDALVGSIIIYRQEVGPFTDKQVDLVKNFAAQAVIAIENARLLNELRQRTTDLGEALEQQTATADVLRVISSSQGELQPVFEAMLQNAVRICDAQFGNLALLEGDVFRFVAQHGVPPKYRDARQREPFLRANTRENLDRVIRTKQVVHIADVAAEDPHSGIATLGGARTLVTVPMLKDDALIGAIVIYRQEVRPFTDKQIELLQNFAAQAVIAIENTRLLNELRERTEEVLKLNQQLEQRVADQVGEIERMGRLRRFLPPQVADLIVASGTEKQLESHRREITALFCDLRGFTGFSESSDPEDVMTLLRDYHAAIGQIIIKYSGTLERYAGDGVMVVFNDPVPVENPAMQAVLMALEMRETIGSLIGKWKRLGHDLGFGIGIAHGFATLGTIGFEGRFDYAAIGTVSNVASRLCDEAKPGQILISPRVLMAVEDAITTEMVGEFTLKGIRRPMAAYNVLAPATSKPN